VTTDPKPLTDDEIANVRDNLANAERTADPWEIVPNFRAVRGLLAEVDRVRTELDSMTRFAEDLRAERDRRLRAEGELGVERDALAAKIEAASELHPAWFCETCNSPNPCPTRRALGLDQDGGGQANG